MATPMIPNGQHALATHVQHAAHAQHAQHAAHAQHAQHAVHAQHAAHTQAHVPLVLAHSQPYIPPTVRKMFNKNDNLEN